MIEGKDVWVPTVCYGCYNCCAVLVHRVDGRIVDIIGDPRSPNSRGFICAKGKARVLDLYDPNRVKTPLKRRNPKKGIGVDPEWEEISWEEALDVIVNRLRKIKAEDPRKLILAHFDLPMYRLAAAFAVAFGTTNYFWNRADYCGSSSHPAWLITNGSLNAEIDFERCNYIVLWGNQLGFGVNTIPLSAANKMAEAKARGAKIVVVDPTCTNAAAKADEWIPIRPGTDGALALSLLNLLLNEYGYYDRTFLKQHTNGIYLIRSDGHYERDAVTGKPLVWDISDQKVKVYDDPTLKDPAIEGTFLVNGNSCQPAFQKLKDHVVQYKPDWASKITTVPEKTIRRFAKEFGEAARIGSTIEIEGVSLPFRPVGIDFKRGVAAHRGGGMTCWAIHLLNIVVGSLDVPGGQRGVNPVGPFWTAIAGKDGLLEPADYITKYNKPFPGSPVKMPQSLDLREIFPAALFTRSMYPYSIDHLKEFKIPYEPEMMIQGRTNLMMNSHNPEAMANTLKKIPFIVSFCVQLDETGEFADIVLPDAHDFERYDLFPANDPYAFIIPGEGDWFWLLRQPVVPPPEKVRPWGEVLLEIAERLGILENLYEAGNIIWRLGDHYKLDPKRKYSIPEIAERQIKTIVGENYSLNHFKESSCVITRKKTLQEAYPRVFLKAKVPIYLEYLLEAKEKVKEVMDKLGMEWNFDGYSPLPIYVPCVVNEEISEEYDLLGTNFKLPFHTFSISGQNLWINEISERHPFAYRILVHATVAEKKGLKEDDWVWVESPYGKVKGRCHITEAIHPECVGIGGTFGHWAKKLPTAREKGAHYNTLLPPPQLQRIDTLNGGIDQCVRVKIYRAKE